MEELGQWPISRGASSRGRPDLSSGLDFMMA
jgi:hypothetical protein